jgi:hypothetical protein
MVALLKKSKEAEVILSFARRNVPVHLFLQKAVEYGFDYNLAKRWDVEDDIDSVGVVLSGDEIVEIDEQLEVGATADSAGAGIGAMEPIFSLRWAAESLSHFQ